MYYVFSCARHLITLTLKREEPAQIRGFSSIYKTWPGYLNLNYTFMASYQHHREIAFTYKHHCIIIFFWRGVDMRMNEGRSQ